MDPSTEHFASERTTIVDGNKRVDALLELWKGTGARITERRSYEWKLAFGIWGVQLVALWQLLSHNNLFSQRALYTLASLYGAMGLFLTVAHGIYVFGSIRNYNNKDSDRRGKIEKEITDIVRLELPERSYDQSSPVHWLEVIMTGSLVAVGTAALVAVGWGR